MNDVTEADLQAYADGKLPEERRAAVAAWLAAHPEDAERIESYRQIGQELRSSYDSVLDEPVPERLARTVRMGRARRVAAVAGWLATGEAFVGLADQLAPSQKVQFCSGVTVGKRARKMLRVIPSRFWP